jgi:uncharacterized protein (TIGR02284 family)
MISNEKLAGMLNDLIRINNDRYEGYASLLSRKVILDKDIWKLVCDLARQSRMNSSALIGQAIKLRTSQQTGSNLTAGIYSPQMGIKSELSGIDRQCILENCRHREDLVQKAYYDALSSGIDIPEDIAILIADQKKEMKAASMLARVKQLQPVSHAA